MNLKKIRLLIPKHNLCSNKENIYFDFSSISYINNNWRLHICFVILLKEKRWKISRNFWVANYLPNLCHSSPKATTRLAQANQYRYPEGLNSNQQHTVDIYHTPVLHFSAVGWGGRKERKSKSNLVKLCRCTTGDFTEMGWDLFRIDLRRNWISIFFGLFSSRFGYMCHRYEAVSAMQT